MVIAIFFNVLKVKVKDQKSTQQKWTVHVCGDDFSNNDEL